MSNKRQSTPPIPPDKRKTLNRDNDDVTDEETRRADRLAAAMHRTSISSKASVSAFAKENTFGGTKKGKMRNLIEIDILSIDTKPYTTSFTQEMAYNEIYRGVLDLPKELIHGIKCAWRGHPFITIKLASPIDIDKLPAKFDYYRNFKESDDVMGQYLIEGQIRGVRPVGLFLQPSQIERWLRIDPDCYDMSEDILREWLSFYGKTLTDFKEDNAVVPAFDEDPEAEAGAGEVQLGKGLLTIKMRIDYPIPEFLPIDGKRIRVHHSGMSKQCLNCYGYGHMRSNCENQKSTWLEYVAGFIANNKEIRPELYGRWYKIVSDKTKQNERQPETLNQSNRTLVSTEQIGEREIETENESETETEYETGEDEAEKTATVATLAEKFDSIETQTRSKFNSNIQPPPTNEKRGRGRPKK